MTEQPEKDEHTAVIGMVSESALREQLQAEIARLRALDDQRETEHVALAGEIARLREDQSLLREIVVERQEEIARLQLQCSQWEITVNQKDAEIARLRAQRGQLIAALNLVMTGGNHIATYRTDRWPSYGTEPADALEKLGAGQEYDMWCCWAAIMTARAAVANQDANSKVKG